MWYPKIPISSYVSPGTYAAGVGVTSVGGGVGTPRRLSLTKPLVDSPKTWTLVLNSEFPTSNVYTPSLTSNLPYEGSEWLVDISCYGGCPWFSSRAYFKNGDQFPFVATIFPKQFHYEMDVSPSQNLSFPATKGSGLDGGSKSNPNLEVISTAVTAYKDGEEPKNLSSELIEPSTASEGILLKIIGLDKDTGEVVGFFSDVQALTTTVTDSTLKVSLENWSGKGYDHISWYVYQENLQTSYQVIRYVENLPLNANTSSYILYIPTSSNNGEGEDGDSSSSPNYCIAATLTGNKKKLNLWCGAGLSVYTPPVIN